MLWKRLIGNEAMLSVDAWVDNPNLLFAGEVASKVIGSGESAGDRDLSGDTVILR